MSSISVNDVTSILAAGAAGSLMGLQPVNNADSSDFSKAMNEAGVREVDVVSELKGSDVSAKSPAVVDKSGLRETNSDNVPAKKDPMNNSEDRKEVADKAATAIDNIKDSIKKNFEISDEEIEAAMETLGLTMIDLLDPTKLQGLLMEISGAGDSMSLLTDADLYASVKDVMNVAETNIRDITSSLDITVDELQDVLKDETIMAEAFDRLLIDNQEIVNAEEYIDLSDTVDLSEINGSETAGVEVIVESSVLTEANNAVDDTDKTSESSSGPANKDDKTVVKPENTEKSSVVETEDGETKTETFRQTSATQNSADASKGRNEGFENSSNFGAAARQKIGEAGEVHEAVEATTTTTTTTVNNVGDIVETVTRYASNDSNEIISQITESIRVNISEDSTSMEMQLHPASLGTVNMQIASNGGVVTAQIIVENEAVKAALESQLVTLQESFEEQGHKVESIEVTVAGYDLGKGNSQSNGKNSEAEDQKNAFKVMGTRRRINLNLLDDSEEIDEEELPEDEKIARDMMARNGNSVDYTV